MKQTPGLVIRTTCRMCDSYKLHKFLDLGNQPLANSFISKEQLNQSEPRYPLEVYWCENCSLTQLIHVVSPDVLFRDYIYFSMGMPKLSNHFKDYAEDALNRFVNDKNQMVVEIGSNDGILLHSIKNRVRVLGIDPARNIAKVANERGVETLPDFFDEILAHSVRETYGPAHIIIGNNVVAHMDNHHGLLRGVQALLDQDGVFIFEAPYLMDMFDNLTFDTIYHEHLSYLAVEPLTRLFSSHGLEVFDVRTYPVQGVSLRVYAGFPGRHPIQSSVELMRQNEKQKGLGSLTAYLYLADRIRGLKSEVVARIQELKHSRKRVAGYGAPAKGNTLLNYYGIGPDILEYVTETLPTKVGTFTPGMHIPVVHIEEARKNPPDHHLLLAWNYQKAVLEQEQDFKGRGGTFIVPVGHTREV